jgi:hypothetical protein
MSVDVPLVSKRVEEGLLNKQLVFAREQCKDTIERFVDCTKQVRDVDLIFWLLFSLVDTQYGVSVIWNCRPLKNEVNTCLAPYTSKEVLEQMKREYVAVKTAERAARGE